MNNNLDLFYPIGSIYASVKDLSPQKLFGGLWRQLDNNFVTESSLIKYQSTIPSHVYNLNNIKGLSNLDNENLILLYTWLRIG